MTTRRKVEPVAEEVEAPVIEPAVEPEPPALGDLGAEAFDPTFNPNPIDGSRPETAEEHAERLGESAGTFKDVGHILGTVVSRPNWPAQPQHSAPPPEPDGGAA
jgi:hypothetical protein